MLVYTDAQNVFYHLCGDGAKGYAKEAPYDKIKVAAATEKATKEWKKQLKLNGKIIFPRESEFGQKLIELKKTTSGFQSTTHGNVRFVPLISNR